MLRIERLRKDIVALSQLAAAAQHRQRTALDQALDWWSHLSEADEIRAHVHPLVHPSSGVESGWTGALPATSAPVGTPVACKPEDLQGLTLIGVDGSQIFPDRHALTLYYFIQVSACVFHYNGQAPDIHVREWLRYQETDLFDTRGYLIDSDMLGMERTVKEMQMLAELAPQERQKASLAVIGLADGPLLWPYADRGRVADESLTTYLKTMQAMRQSGAAPVGYVDRPGGRHLLEMLWACQLSEDELAERWRDNPLHPLDDEEFVLHLLAPGERTAWFTRPSSMNMRHAEAGQEIWFCYQRMDNREPGYTSHPTAARIEAPAWAIEDGTLLELLHAALQHQAYVLNGYPYVLARAHEEALVTTQDKTALEQSIQRELFNTGIFAEASDKARQKLLLGRK